MTDKTLEAKLKKLTETGEQMQAIVASMSEKQEMIENLQANQSKFEGLPAVGSLSQEIVRKLQEEIEEEKKMLSQLQAELPSELNMKTPIEF